MNHTSSGGRRWILASAPALVLGVLVMRASGVPVTAWGQNIAAWMLGALLCVVLGRPHKHERSAWWADATMMLTLGLLAATLIAPGLDGVHRWIKIGPLRLHAAAIMLPVMLVALEHLARARSWLMAMSTAVAVTVMLSLQPDVAQATAFAVASSILLVEDARRSVPRAMALLALPTIAAMAWLRPDPLAPVPHVEQIVSLAGTLGPGWTVAAYASLLLLPVPFFVQKIPTRFASGMTAYIAITILATFIGNFPVPIMGYGISPILGYFAGLSALLRVTGTTMLRSDDMPGRVSTPT